METVQLGDHVGRVRQVVGAARAVEEAHDPLSIHDGDAPQLEQYQRFLDLLGDQAWMQESRYRDRRAMSVQYPEEAEALIAPWFMEHTKEEILRLCLDHRIPCVPVKTFDEVMIDPQLNARDYFQEVSHPQAGSFRYPGPPYRLSASPSRVVRPAPTLGQHNREVLGGELGLGEAELMEMAESGII